MSASVALWAKSYLTEIVEGHILCLDSGEEPEEACRTEDSEAEPTASDPWLQGCMPVVNAAPQQTTSNQVHFLTYFWKLSDHNCQYHCVCHLHNYGGFFCFVFFVAGG